MQLVNVNVEWFKCSKSISPQSRIGKTLNADPSVLCNIGKHGQLVYVVGFPVYVILLLFTHRRLLSKRDVIDVHSRPLSVTAGQLLKAEQKFGFIFRRYKSSYSWWIYITPGGKK